MSVYKKFTVTVTGELENGEKYTHEFEFANPKNVHISQTRGYSESEVDGKTLYTPTGHGTFDVKVEH